MVVVVVQGGLTRAAQAQAGGGGRARAAAGAASGCGAVVQVRHGVVPTRRVQRLAAQDARIELVGYGACGAEVGGGG